jgi:hypothetical protein
MASMKQATYIREQYPDSKARIFYIDLRTPGRYEQFYWKVKDDPNVSFTKGKVANITEDPETKDVIIGRKMAGKKIKARSTWSYCGRDGPLTKTKDPGELTPDALWQRFPRRKHLCCRDAKSPLMLPVCTGRNGQSKH